MCSQALWNWWESPFARHRHTRIAHAALPGMRGSARGQTNVTKELGKVPTIRFAPPNVGNEGDMVVFSERVESLWSGRAIGF